MVLIESLHFGQGMSTHAELKKELHALLDNTDVE